MNTKTQTKAELVEIIRALCAEAQALREQQDGQSNLLVEVLREEGAPLASEFEAKTISVKWMHGRLKARNYEIDRDDLSQVLGRANVRALHARGKGKAGNHKPRSTPATTAPEAS